MLVAGRTTEEGEALESWARRVYNIKTTPKKVKNLASFKKDYIQWRLKDDRINIKWDKNPKDEVYAEGYKIVHGRMDENATIRRSCVDNYFTKIINFSD